VESSLEGDNEAVGCGLWLGFGVAQNDRGKKKLWAKIGSERRRRIWFHLALRARPQLGLAQAEAVLRAQRNI